MTKEADYRRNAADSVGLANRANSTADKARLLRLAEAWLSLAERAHEADPDPEATDKRAPTDPGEA